MIAAGMATAVMAAVCASVVFGRVPHVQDSIAQLFQARIFAEGRLWFPSPPLREFFDYAHMVNDGRWYSQYPPGHALLLVPGVWLGAPWLVNPVLAGLGVAATYLLSRVTFDRATARVSALLALVSPFLLFMAAGFMSHVSGFFLLTGFLACLALALRDGRTASGAAAAALLSLAVLTRPYTAVAMAMPAMAWVLASRSPATHDRRPAGNPPASRMRNPFRMPNTWWIVPAGLMAGLVLYGLYNWGTTGDPFLPGYIKLYGPAHGIGFGKGSWGPPHTPSLGLLHARQSLVRLNAHLFQWPVSSLWPVILALLPPLAWVRWLGGRRAAGTGTWPDHSRVPADSAAPLLEDQWKRAWLLAAFPLALLGAYIFYWYYDSCFGPRYLYDALGPLLVVSGWGIVRAARRLQTLRAGGRPWGARGAAGVLALLVLGFVLYAALARCPRLTHPSAEAATALPGSPPRIASYFLNYTPQYWGVSPYLGRLVAREGLRNALVFVRSRERQPDALFVRHLWFGSAFAHERPDLARANVIYAHDRGTENVNLARLFPGRRYYVYAGSIEEGKLIELPALEREPADGRGAEPAPAD